MSNLPTPDWQSDDGRVRLFCADCLDLLPRLPNGCVDLLLTDPPYFLPARHYCTRKEFPRSLSDLGILELFFREVFREARRVTSDAGCWYVFCDGQSYPVLFAVAYSHHRRMVPLVWDKMTSINGYSWRHQHELILFCETDGYPAVKTGDGDVLQCRSVPVEEREHPAEKPLALLERMILKSGFHRHSSREGDALVCDPFMGSAATGVACVRTGRQFIGIEKEERYFQIAVRRIKEAMGYEVENKDGSVQKRLFTPEASQ